MRKQVLFVCLGNICRSPSAEAIFRDAIALSGLDVAHDSAGTSGWHKGEPPYGPMQDAALTRGFAMADLRSRQVRKSDFDDFDVIVAMDKSNLHDLIAMRPSSQCRANVVLMGDYLDDPIEKGSDVPDPYYTRDFDATLDMLSRAMSNFIATL